jgi:hypothetical protein
MQVKILFCCQTKKISTRQNMFLHNTRESLGNFGIGYENNLLILQANGDVVALFP